MRQYMEQLRARGQLLEVRREVQARHELAAVTQAAQRRYGKPILFHSVSGTKLPVLTNIYGSRDRLAEILGIAPGDFCRQWSQLAALTAGRRPAQARGGDAGRPGRRPPRRSSAAHLCRARRRFRTSPPRSTWPASPRRVCRTYRFHRSMYVSDQELRVRLPRVTISRSITRKAERMGRPLEAAMLLGPPPQVVPRGPPRRCPTTWTSWRWPPSWPARRSRCGRASTSICRCRPPPRS